MNSFTAGSHDNCRAFAVITVIFFGLAIGLAGCGVPENVKIGGYDHQDLSKSEYKDIILEQAQTLAKTKNPEDWRTAAKHYGAIGMLDEMDQCIRKYLQKEPESGRNLIYVGQQIHQFYEGR